MTFTRYDLTIPVELTSELHIGGVDDVPDRDGEGTVIRFCRNGLGEPTIPGRSIRGAVRAACNVLWQERKLKDDPSGAFSETNWKSLWGDDLAHHEGDSPEDVLPVRRSALTFYAVSFPQYNDSDSGESPLPRRHGIGIDRTTGAASDGALYEHEFLPRGTRFNIRITAEGRDGEKMENEQSEGIPGPAPSESVKKLLEVIVDILKSDTVCLGGRTGSGQGTIQVIEPKLHRTGGTTDAGTLTAPADILDALIGPDSEGTPIPLELGGWSLEEPARIKITWWSPTGIFVAEDEKLTKQRKEEARKKDPTANGVTEPLRDPSVPWDEAQLLIPGTSIRGALRSRASRIARTVLAARDELSAFASHDLHEQIAAEPNLVRYMFGTTEYRGAVTVHDCLSTERGKRIEVTHNAIDRWTGGVIDGGLFTEAVYLGTKWQPITIDIDLRQLLNNIEAEKGPEDAGTPVGADETGIGSEDREQPNPTHADYAHAAYVLLGLVLAELSAGTLPLGSRSTRGLGQVVVSTIKVEGADRKGVDLPSWNFTGCEALQQSATGAGVMTDTLYEGQRELAKLVLKHLKKKYEETDWSKRLENGPGAARKQSEGTGAADD